MKLIKGLFLIIFSVVLCAMLFAVGYYFGATKSTYLSHEKLVFNEKNLILYDENGEAIQGAFDGNVKQTTAIAQIPEHTKKAFIDVEDKRFFTHNGYDLKGIIRASLHNLKSHSFKEGASTISQQLIKNTHLSQEKTVKRKLKEWKLTRALERTYSKEEILEKYLNTIYFGHNCFGITSAARFYFGKMPSELSLDESALLAGLVKSPNNYSPFKNPEKCIRRRAIVLNAMQKNGSISTEEQKKAENAPIPLSPTKNLGEGYLHFVFDELTDLAEKRDFALGGKIEIYTYLNPVLQAETEKIAEGYAQSDKAMLVLDNETGGFKACVSTVGNIARLPGSLIKPLVAYAPALEENILTPATPLLDEKVSYDGYSPENFDGKYHGYTSVRECVEKSLNIPAVKTLQALTIEKAAGYMQKLGLPVLEEDKSLALALGGMKKGYSVKDILSAYSTFPRGGKYLPCGFIRAVKINDKTVYEKPTQTAPVFSEETAYLTTDILKSTAQKGTAKKLRTLPFDVAGKTGTVGTKKGNTDAYALSFTSKDCAVVWLGNADNTTIDTTGGGIPCNLLFQLNQAISSVRQNTITPFAACEKVIRVDLDKRSYEKEHSLLLADDLAPVSYRINELFKKNALPLEKSTLFSRPSIPTPEILRTDDCVELRFDKENPDFYTYKIERREGENTTTLYEGKLPTHFIDDTIAENKTYCYTITPFYENREGEKITLPTVSTKKGEAPNLNDREILSKNWWEE